MLRFAKVALVSKLDVTLIPFAEAHLHSAPYTPMATTALILAADQAHDATSDINLLTLPPEMFERIAQSLPIEDLPYLRLTCRDAAAKVERTYVQAHFTDRGFLLCYKQSLQTAIDIARHEKFGKALKSITLYVDDIKPKLINRSVAYHLTPFGRVQQRLHQDGCDAARKQLFNQQQAMREEEDDLNALTVLFSHLRQHAGAIEVEVVTRHDDRGNLPRPARHPWGWATIDVQTGNGLHIPDDVNCHISNIVISAIAISGFQPITLWLGGFSWRLPLSAFHGAGSRLQGLVHTFEKLRKLHISLWTVWHWQDDDPALQSQSLAILISGAQHLQELSIDIEWDWEKFSAWDNDLAVEVVFNALSSIDGQYLPNLRILRLQGHTIEARDVVAFVRNRTSIQLLDLVECSFKKCWDRQGDEDVGQYVERAAGFTGLRADDCTAERWSQVNDAVDGEEDNEGGC